MDWSTNGPVLDRALAVDIGRRTGAGARLLRTSAEP
jgi:hypothetical protein